jgi:dTDP-glucose 4,6-dehydratase
MILVTGGSGFIGTNFISHWLSNDDELIVNIDKLTTMKRVHVDFGKNYRLAKVDINDYESVSKIIIDNQPRVIINFAAETHVDHSISNSDAFVQTNICGTHKLLNATFQYWSSLDNDRKSRFRFIHVSTDEVYGEALKDETFTESSQYLPNNPYSASKAASDHLVRAWNVTHGLPTITTNCGNNYGPHQAPDKFIPLVILNCLFGKPIPIYGNGSQERDWIYVKDHCEAITKLVKAECATNKYNIGANEVKKNIEVAYEICDLMDLICPLTVGSHRDLIINVKDRLGHDKRYSIDSAKIRRDLIWEPKVTFREGIMETILWYIQHRKSYF